MNRLLRVITLVTSTILCFFCKIAASAQCPPPAPYGSDVSSCGTATLTLQATTLNAPAGAIHRWYLVSSGGTPISGPVTVSSGGTTLVSNYRAEFNESKTFYVSTFSGTGCESARVTVKAIINTTTAFAVTSAALCGSGQATLGASGAPSGSTITWYNANNVQVGTGATYTTPVLSSTTSYTATLNASGCTASRTATVTVHAGYLAPTASSNTVCPGQRATLTASGAPAGSLYAWFDAAGNQVQAPSSPNTYLTPALSANTTYYVSYELTASPFCRSSRTAVTAQVGPPNAPATTGRSSCSGNTVTLSASGLPGGGTFRWYDAANNLVQNSTSATFVTPVLTTTTTYYVSVYTQCESAKTPVIATITSIPAPTAGSVSSCGPGTVRLQATTLNAPAGAVHHWYLESSGGTPISGPVTESSGSTLVTSYTADFTGTTTFYVSTFVSTGCESARVAVTATVQTGVSFSVTNAAICGSGQATLVASGAPAGSTITWYNASGVQVGSGASYTTPVLGSTTTYTATLSGAGCTASRTATATVYPGYSAPLVSANTVCVGERTTLTASGAPAGSLYAWFDAAGNQVQFPSTSNTYLTPALSAATTFYVSYELTASPFCKSSRVAVTTRYHAVPGLPSTTAASYTFADSDDYEVSATPGTNGNTCRWYETATGGVPFEGLTFNPSSDCLLSRTVYVCTYNTTTGCEGSRRAITLNVGPNYCKNLIRVWDVQKNNELTESTIEGLQVPNVIQTTKYFDGLGRFSQEVAKQQSPEPSKLDLIVQTEYDAVGRENKTSLPYASGTDGNFKRNFTADQAAFYNAAGDNIVNDAQPFSVVLYEPSPLNRPLKRGAPGAVWQPNTSPYSLPTDRTVKSVFEASLANEVLQWTYALTDATNYPMGFVNASNTTTPVYYAAGQLLKTRAKDEHQNEVIEYKDKEGKTILKKVQAGSADWAETYYVYDDLDRLVTVIPPQAVALVTKTISDYFSKTDAEKDAFLQQWAYRYRYDARGRMILKQMPGAGNVTMVYDNRNRLVFVQDANQRAKSEWSYTKYDVLDRPVISGIYRPTTAVIRPTLQTQVDALNSNAGYQNADVTAPNATFPTTATEALSLTYYDSYSACSFCSQTNDTNPHRFQAETWETTTGAEPFAQSMRTRGLLVGTSVKVLGAATATWINTVNYYDARNRLIQSVSSNHRSGYDRVSLRYDFTGKVLEKLNTPTSYAAGYPYIRERFTYDHAGRLVNQYHQVGTNTAVVLANHTYNALGQLVDKKLHSNETGTTFAQSVDYQYNIRGWLTHINNSALNDGEGDRFGMELLYQQGATVNGVTYPGQFNGNISAVRWQSNDGSAAKQHTYGYSYDAMGRLKEGKYASLSGTTWTGDAGLYDEAIFAYDAAGNVISGYDKNGNIRRLERYGKVNGARTAIDILNYAGFNGNQVTRIDETGLSGKSFKNLVSQAGEYEYDVNGNMTKDLNKGIGKMDYNLLNLPQEVTAGTGSLKYTYTAGGQKLTKTVTDGGSAVTHYMGVAEYKGEVLAQPVEPVLLQLTTAEGRAVPSVSTAGAFDYEYHLKDHLGNVRVALSTATKQPIAYDALMETKATDVAEGYTYADNVRHLGDGYNSSTYSARLNGSQGTVLGPSIALKVSPGDRVTLEAYAKYIGTGTHNATLFSTVKSTAATTAQTLTEGSATAITGAFNLLPATAFSTPTSVPRAYLNYILFDEEFNYTAGESGFDPVKGTTQNLYEKLTRTVDIRKEGYIYIYAANESNLNVNVFFDNFKVTLTEGPVVARSDYYPFGMLIEGLSHATASDGPNKYLYNGKELQDDKFGGVALEMYDYGARMYDPQLGRWHVPDALADDAPNLTPYRYCFNNPVNYIDPTGLWEVTAGGYKTSDVKDINRFVSYMQLESIGGKSPSVGQMNGFIYGEMNNPGGGRLSDGSRLLTGINMVGSNDEGWSPTQSSIRRTLREMYGEYSENQSIGAPGTAESMIPVWGSGRAAINDFQNGNYGWAAFNAGMAVSDVFLVKSIGTAIVKGAFKIGGNHAFRGTFNWATRTDDGFRAWYAARYNVPRGAQVHHALIPNNGWGRRIPDWFKNQPWNMKVFPNQQMHFNAGHGWWHLDSPPYSRLGQFWYGTPDWTKAILGSGGGRIVEGAAR